MTWPTDHPALPHLKAATQAVAEAAHTMRAAEIDTTSAEADVAGLLYDLPNLAFDLTQTLENLRRDLAARGCENRYIGLHKPVAQCLTEADTALANATTAARTLLDFLGRAARAAHGLTWATDTGRLARLIFGYIADDEPGVEHLMDDAAAVCDANLDRLRATDHEAAEIFAGLTFAEARQSLEAEHRLINAITRYWAKPGAVDLFLGVIDRPST